LPWFAVRVPGDNTLIKTLQDKHIEYEAVSESGMSEMIWMLVVPIGIGLLYRLLADAADVRRHAGRTAGR